MNMEQEDDQVPAVAAETVPLKRYVTNPGANRDEEVAAAPSSQDTPYFDYAYERSLRHVSI